MQKRQFLLWLIHQILIHRYFQKSTNFCAIVKSKATCFVKKITLFVILLQFRTVLLPYKTVLLRTEQK
jgi:hypothetical protein